MSDIKVGDFVFTDKAINSTERGLSGFVVELDANGVRVDTATGDALSFLASSVTRIAPGDLVLVRSSLFPSWNGEARVEGFYRTGEMVFVRPVAGLNAGVEGSFRPDEITPLIQVTAPAEPEEIDYLRVLAGDCEKNAGLLSGNAALLSEAAAYALALADVLDAIKENALV